jgi:hypothetical protein
MPDPEAGAHPPDPERQKLIDMRLGDLLLSGDVVRLRRAQSLIGIAHALAEIESREPKGTPDPFVCPVCLSSSYHPRDKAEGWCGRCGRQTATNARGEPPGP